VNTSILVVDDDDAHRGMLRMMLQAWGYSVDEAADGDLAVEAVRAKPYDVVLADISAAAEKYRAKREGSRPVEEGRPK